ncbi:hypothetical protein KFE98_21275 [bacterium SCSIO 12741]|nr:hypothetical protein KFE98_21275 [bacterium SCSIO 12741]
MKKSIIITGCISAGLVLLGCLFKMQHYPGASFMLLIGTLLFSMVTLTLFLIYRIQIRRTQFDVFAGVIITVTTWLLTMGLLFKIQHYPGGTSLLYIGQILLIFGLIPVAIVSFNKSENPYSGLNLMALLAAFTGITMASTISYSLNSLQGHLVSYRQTHSINSHQIDRNALLHERLAQSGNTQAQADQIYALSNETWEEIEDAQVRLMATVDMLPIERAEEMEFWEIMNIDNSDVSSQLFIGADSWQPSKEPGSALALRASVESYAEQLSGLMKNPKNRITLEEYLRDFFQTYETFGTVESWEVENFYHASAISAGHVLESMQSLVLSLEELAYEDLMDQSQPETSAVE